jgi:hypothetical protein
MSSLQKFHRRTNGGLPPFAGFTTIGSGSDTVGYWLAGPSTNRLVVAPKSTELTSANAWGSSGTVRGTVNTTDGLANTNTLAGFGQAAHPAAYYCKNLTTGGYNTWYLPARDELLSCISNKRATPFATANQFVGNSNWSSTEYNAQGAWTINGFDGSLYNGNESNYKARGYYSVRPVRRSVI